MASFEKSSKWLKLSLLEIHLALFLLLFPMAASSNLTSGPVTVLAFTSFVLLCACVLTFTWIYVQEVHNNRIIHLSVMIADFLVGIFGVITVIVLYHWNDYDRYDNVIEASVAVSILAFLAGLFAVWEMQEFKFKLPSFRKNKNKINVDQAKQGEAVDTVAPGDPVKDAATNNAKKALSDNTGTEGAFSRSSMWLKFASYLFGMSLFLSFLPTEPSMKGGTREVTIMVYLCSIVTFSLLFCWIYVCGMHKKKAIHVIAAFFAFLTAFFCIVAMILWLISWSMIHPFTPILVFAAGLLSCLSGVAIILEIRQLKLTSKTRYFDREWAASCFHGVLKTFHIQGVNVTVEKDAVMNGDLVERHSQQGGSNHDLQSANKSLGDNNPSEPDFTPDSVMVDQQEATMKGGTAPEGDERKSDKEPPPDYKNAQKYREGAQSGKQEEGKKHLQVHHTLQPGSTGKATGMTPASGMGDEQPRPGYNPFDEGD